MDLDMTYSETPQVGSSKRRRVAANVTAFVIAAVLTAAAGVVIDKVADTVHDKLAKKDDTEPEDNTDN